MRQPRKPDTKLVTEGFINIEKWLPHEKVRYEPATNELHLISHDNRIVATMQPTHIRIDAHSCYAAGSEGVVYVNPR